MKNRVSRNLLFLIVLGVFPTLTFGQSNVTKLLKDLEALDPTEQVVSQKKTVASVYAQWDDNEKRGTAIYQAPTGWFIKEADLVVGGWGGYGGSMRKLAQSSSGFTLQDLKSEYDALDDLIANAKLKDNDERSLKLALAKQRSFYERNLSAWMHSHSTVEVDWRVESDGNFFDRKRGWVNIQLKLVEEKAQNMGNVVNHIGMVKELLTVYLQQEHNPKKNSDTKTQTDSKT